MADIPLPVPIADIPLPGPVDDILWVVIFRNMDDTLRIMESYHGVPAPHDSSFIVRINALEEVIAASFRQSFIASAYEGRGERNKDEHHQSMAHLLDKIRARDLNYRKALYDLRHHSNLFTLEKLFHDFNLDFCLHSYLLELISTNPLSYFEWLVNNPSRHLLTFLGKRRIRRRNKQRWRRALSRVTCAKAKLCKSIRKLIHAAMKYHLICSIEMAQGRSSKFSVVSRDSDVRVIEVMISLFPRKRYWVTSYIDLVGEFRYYNVEPGIQDGDNPRKYRLTRSEEIFYV